MAYKTTKRNVATFKIFRKNARICRSDPDRPVPRFRRKNKHASTPATHAQLGSQPVSIEAANVLLSLVSSQARLRKLAGRKPEKSSLDRLCEAYNIHEFPENPAEALRGLLSEFNIKESSTEIIRDIRDNRTCE